MCRSNKFDGEKWINQTQLKDALGHSNIASKTQCYSSEYKRKRHEIQDCDDYQPCRMFLKRRISSNNNDGHKNNKSS